VGSHRAYAVHCEHGLEDGMRSPESWEAGPSSNGNEGGSGDPGTEFSADRSLVPNRPRRPVTGFEDP
jgi:hypothetical protein